MKTVLELLPAYIYGALCLVSLLWTMIGERRAYVRNSYYNPREHSKILLGAITIIVMVPAFYFCPSKMFNLVSIIIIGVLSELAYKYYHPRGWTTLGTCESSVKIRSLLQELGLRFQLEAIYCVISNYGQIALVVQGVTENPSHALDAELKNLINVFQKEFLLNAIVSYVTTPPESTGFTEDTLVYSKNGVQNG